MARFVRKLTKRIFIVLNLVFANLFLIACANAWLHPEKWWFFSLLGFAFPVLLIVVFSFMVFWIIVRNKWFVLSALALVLGFTNIRVFWGMHFATSFKPEKKEGSLRILTWNVEWFSEHKKKYKAFRHYRQKMMEFIEEQNADIMCFQEFVEPGKGFNYSNVKELIALKYPYHYRAVDYGQKGGRYEVGVAIFSRYPIVDTQRIRYPGPPSLRAAESLISADILVNNQRIRVYTTHLQSVMFRKNDYQNLRIIKSADDSLVTASRSIIRKLRMGYYQRGNQADLVRAQLDSCTVPEIIAGDFNDIPNSYTYFTIKGNRQDAFVQKGKGTGRSFSFISPTLRIDYILADKKFKVLQYNRFKLPWSDHYPLVADLALPGSEY